MQKPSQLRRPKADRTAPASPTFSSAWSKPESRQYTLGTFDQAFADVHVEGGMAHQEAPARKSR